VKFVPNSSAGPHLICSRTCERWTKGRLHMQKHLFAQCDYMSLQRVLRFWDLSSFFEERLPESSSLSLHS
jgi:hypothetical protein